MPELGFLIDCRHLYAVPTDEKGVAVITTLPAGTSETPTQSSFIVEHSEFKMPHPDGPFRPMERVALVAGETSETTIRMQLGKETID